ncbi:hypothetical protein JCM31271_22980 [Halorubrum trueperi]
MAGGGAILSTGAFDTVEADRTVSVETAGDANALLGLEPADRDGDDNNAYVEETDDTIAINLDGNDPEGADGLNQNAITTFRNLVTVTNQGTQTVNSVTLEFTDIPGDADASETFSFPVDEFDGDSEDSVDNGGDILTGEDDITDSLESGDSINFGIEIDLINGGDEGDLDNGDYTLTITAESDDS